MAWIQFANQSTRTAHVNLDDIVAIVVEEKTERIDIYVGSAYFTLEKKRSPEAYQQVIDYLATKPSK